MVTITDLPVGAVFKGYEPYVVQELTITCQATRYLRARFELPEGGSVLAPLPAEVIPGSGARRAIGQPPCAMCRNSSPAAS